MWIDLQTTTSHLSSHWYVEFAFGGKKGGGDGDGNSLKTHRLHVGGLRDHKDALKAPFALQLFIPL